MATGWLWSSPGDIARNDVHRFFIAPDCLGGDSVTLKGQVSRQLARVLRSRPGDRIVVLDNSGWEYMVTLTEVRPDQARGRVVERSASASEPAAHITMYQGVLKTSRFELVLEKGTELGVTTFVPVFCERSVPKRRDPERAAIRCDRWRRIITEAAEQSGRGRVPVLEEPVEFSQACDYARHPAIIPWEDEVATGLKAALGQFTAKGWDGTSLSVIVGPEGGFTRDEIGYARDRGLMPVSLGDRILRAETAGIAVAAAVFYELGCFGG